MNVIKKIGSLKGQLNQSMEGKYSSHIIALAASAIAALFMVIMLFFPSYLGVADDGSLMKVMDAAGLSYTTDDSNDIYFNYFVKTYSLSGTAGGMSGGSMTSHIYIIKLAKWLDHLFTDDNFFDIRFLALIYGVMYVPAVYLLIRQACLRAKSFSEGVTIGVVGLLIFSDVAYITYFNSFYPEAIWFISLMYCIAAAISFQEKREIAGDGVYLAVLLIFCLIFITSKQQCAVIGIIFAFFCLRLIFVRAEWVWRVACVLASLLIIAVSLGSMLRGENDFTQASKYHAMTRGVLFGADDPAETLEGFGISSSYEILADMSSYEELPIVDGEDEILRKGFLDKYGTGDIIFYYMKHPAQYINMMDIPIKSCFGIRREFCGNYEKSVGLPEKAKSTFWSLWSRFKGESMPRTIGYLAVLFIAACVMFGKGYSIRPQEVKAESILLDSMIILCLICVLQSGITIVNSGDAEMIRHCFPVSLCIDIMTYYIFASLVHKTKIF